MPLEREIPLPEGGALALFERIRDLPSPVLLHSDTGLMPRGRWDILSASPIRSFVLDAPVGASRVEGCHDGASLLQRVRDALADLPKASADDAPFRWGVLGYLGYAALHDEFGVARPRPGPGLPCAALGIYGWSARVDRTTGHAWFSAASAEDPAARLALARLLGATQGAKTCPPLRAAASPAWVEPDLADYERGFAAVQGYLHAGDCYQINLARRFRTPWDGDPWRLFRALRRELPGEFGAFLQSQFGTVLCCSPERLLSLRGRTLTSQPIKGTRPRSLDPVEDQRAIDDLQSSAKDRAENLMITDLVRNDLGRVADVGSVVTPSLFAVRTLPTVHHLESMVQAKLQTQFDAFDALCACFPAGSITGAPKRRAIEIIDALEPDPRSVYCGAIGYVDASGNCDFNVAIRTLTVEDGYLHCWGGGGIVADSTLEDELLEIEAKVGSLRAAALGAEVVR